MASSCAKEWKLLILLTFFIHWTGIGVAKLCQVHPYPKRDESDLSNSPKPGFDCPRPTDPDDHSECCAQAGAGHCCPPQRHFYEIDNRIATAIAVSVTLTCLVLTVITVICCFWSKCPLYSACRVQYSSQGEIMYGKEAESPNLNILPPESVGRKSKISLGKPSVNETSSAVWSWCILAGRYSFIGVSAKNAYFFLSQVF